MNRHEITVIASAVPALSCLVWYSLHTFRAWPGRRVGQ